MKQIKLKEWWIYQNNIVFSKTFEFWIKNKILNNTKELKKIIKELYKKWWNFHYHQHVVWINTNFIIKEIEFILDDLFSKLKEKIINWRKNDWKWYWSVFIDYVKKLDEDYLTIKDNILWIFQWVTLTKWYFSYSTPKLFWSRNNPNMYASYSKEFSKFMTNLNNSKLENFFKNYNKNDVYLKESLIEIYPSDITVIWKKETSVLSSNYIDQNKYETLDNIVDDMYNYFLDTVIESFIDDSNELIEKKVNDVIDDEEKRKEILLSIFQLYQKKVIDYSFKTFYNKMFLDFNWWTFLYEDQITSKVVDLVFYWNEEYSWWKVIFDSKANLEYLKEILREWINQKIIDSFVLKIDYHFTWETFIVEKSNFWYKFKHSSILVNAELNEEEWKLINEIWELWNKEIKFWVTLWLYWTNVDKINKMLEIISQSFANNKTRVFFNNENVNYSNNNYLYAWATAPTSYMHSTLASVWIKKIFELTPYIDKDLEFDWMYFWIDQFSKFPIFKNPFKMTRNKNMLITWTTWSGKTYFSIQQILTNIKDKFIILDPTWSFSQVSNIANNVFVWDIYNMDYSFIYMNKNFYDNYNLDFESFIESKVELLKDLLINNSFSKETKDLLSSYFFSLYIKYNWKITLDLILDNIKDIYLTKKIEWEFLINLWINKKEDMDEDWFIKIPNEIKWDLKNLILYFNTLKQKPLYKILNKKEDSLEIFFKYNKIIFNISWLGLQKSDKLDTHSAIMYKALLLNILWYLSLNRDIVKKNIWNFWANFPYHYLIIDEVHFLLKNESLFKLFQILVKSIRNMYAQITWLTQNLSEFIVPWKWKELELISNFAIKFMYWKDDITTYIKLLWWNTDNLDEENEENETEDVKELKLLSKPFIKIYNQTDYKKPWSRIVLMDYFWKYYLLKTETSMFMQNKSELLKTW